jgi:hypothetical protein
MNPSLLILLLLTITSAALPVKFRWDANPPADAVKEYRVYQLSDNGPRILKATIQATADPKQTSGPIEADSGQQYVLTAVNIFESEPSDPVTIPNKPSKPGLIEVVEIQVSSNLKEWDSIAMVPLKNDRDPVRFIRTRIVSVLPSP